MEGMDVLKVILLLVGFCLLLFLTYVTTRYIGGKQNKAMRGKNISIVETVSLGMDKRIHLIKAGDQHILIASTAKTVEFLTTVSLDEETAGQETDVYETGNPFDFRVFFEKYADMYKAKKDKTNETAAQNTATRDIPENRDFRSNLGRLRSIVQKSSVHVKENGDDFTNEK